jgi:hypothetical protein
MYREGRFVPLDYVRAHIWYSLSAAQGLRYAATGRDQIAPHMTAAQIAEAERLAREWKPLPQAQQRDIRVVLVLSEHRGMVTAFNVARLWGTW